MEIKAETKLVVTGGSLRTTVPKKITEIYGLENGDSLCWRLKIVEGKPTLTLVPKCKDPS